MRQKITGKHQENAENVGRGAYPRIFASIGDFTRRTPFSKAWLDSVRKKSALTIVEPGNRVSFEAFLQAVAAIGMNDLEVIDGKYEQDALTRARRIEQEAINASREAEVIWSKDKKFALSSVDVMDTLMSELLTFKKEFLALAKKHGHEKEFRALLEKFFNQLK